MIPAGVSVASLQAYIESCTYMCPGCQWRITGLARMLARYEYDCPRCGKYSIRRDFRRIRCE